MVRLGFVSFQGAFNSFATAVSNFSQSRKEAYANSGVSYNRFARSIRGSAKNGCTSVGAGAFGRDAGPKASEGTPREDWNGPDAGLSK